MSDHGVNDGPFTKVPDVNIVVDAAGIELVAVTAAGFGAGDGDDGVFGLDEIDGRFLPGIPYLFFSDQSMIHKSSDCSVARNL